MESPAQRYDRLALPFVRAYTRLLLADLAVPAGALVLDHGAGTGEVSLAVHRAHPTAAVTAVDPDPGMLDQLRAKAGPDAATWLTVIPGTADALDPDYQADLVLSQLVLSLTPDPAAELAALVRRARPGGHLRVAVLGGPDRMRAFAAYWQAAANVLPGAAPPEAYPHMRFTHPATLCRLTLAAGWAQPRIQPADTVRAATAEQLWEWLSVTLPVYDRGRQALPPEAVSDHCDRLREATLDQLSPYRAPGGLYQVPTAGWLVHATRPD